jgi:hypothetical protein
MASNFIQDSYKPHQRLAQVFGADDVNLRVGQPELFNGDNKVYRVAAVLPGLELSLQMLGSFDIHTDSATNLGASSLMPLRLGSNPRLAHRISLSEYCRSGPD